ncbi:hypothetical protein ACHAWF_006613 [Thalassiosira exigua]
MRARRRALPALLTTAAASLLLARRSASAFRLPAAAAAARPPVAMATAASASSGGGDVAASGDGPTTATPLSVAVLGGGIAGLSCARRLLSGRPRDGTGGMRSSELEVTLFDTGRLRPGGRCSSRLPGDPPPAIKNRSGGTHPIKKGGENDGGRANDPGGRRACDDRETSNPNSNDGKPKIEVPENIRRALSASSPDERSNRDRIVDASGPVDHAAQILSVPSATDADAPSSFDEFEAQLRRWEEDGTIEPFPAGSVRELRNDGDGKAELRPLEGEMWYGKGGMGNVPLAIRDECASFDNFRIRQDVWVSPSHGVKYIGSEDGASGDEDDPAAPKWELRAGKRSLGKYHRLIVAHNGKCADRIMSKAPARALHSLLRTRFAPFVPKWGGKEMTLNSIYSLVFAVKGERAEGEGAGGSTGPLGRALADLAAPEGNEGNEGDVYTVMVKNHPDLRLLSCNTLKHDHVQNPNSDGVIEVYTLLSSAEFGEWHKGPQENLPPELQEEVTVKLLGSLERSLGLAPGSVTNDVVDLRVQLWGAAVPLNTWRSSTTGGGGADGFVYDAAHGVGACGDWILDPSVAGAWESGRRLADWVLADAGGVGGASAGLPDRSSRGDGAAGEGGGGGKFVPSRAALGSGIGTVPAGSDSAYEFPEPPARSGRPARGRRRNGSGRNPRRGSGVKRTGDIEATRKTVPWDS